MQGTLGGKCQKRVHQRPRTPTGGEQDQAPRAAERQRANGVEQSTTVRRDTTGYAAERGVGAAADRQGSLRNTQYEVPKQG